MVRRIVIAPNPAAALNRPEPVTLVATSKSRTRPAVKKRVEQQMAAANPPRSDSSSDQSAA
jgi:hypothetical protein